MSSPASPPEGPGPGSVPPAPPPGPATTPGQPAADAGAPPAGAPGGEASAQPTGAAGGAPPGTASRTSGTPPRGAQAARRNPSARRKAGGSGRRRGGLQQLRLGHVIAFVAALGLMLSLAVDWYTTEFGAEARRLQELAQPGSGESGTIERYLQEDAEIQAEEEERNAFQPANGFDRGLLVALLAVVALTLLAVVARARGAPNGARGPTALAGVASLLVALAIIVRMLAQPGIDDGTRIAAGVPLGLLFLGLITFGTARASRPETKTKPGSRGGARKDSQTRRVAQV